MILKNKQCHACKKDLEKVGVSSLLECPKCGRKMISSEWDKLSEGEGFNPVTDVHKSVLLPQDIVSKMGDIRMVLFDSDRIISHELVLHEAVDIAYRSYRKGKTSRFSEGDTP